MRLEVISRKPETSSHSAPVLFVHGMWFAAWCREEYFMPCFARHGYEVHALSLRGHGGSEKVEHIRRVSLEDYLADLIEVAERIERPPVLLGHSMGSLLVQKYLENRRPSAAVLLASVPPNGDFPATCRIIRRHPLIALKVNATMSMQTLVSTPELFRELNLSEAITGETLISYFDRAGNDSYRAFLGMHSPNLKQRYNPDVPVLVLGAGKDMIMSEQDVRRTGEYYGVEAEIFPRMAHCMMLEPGWQKVADRIIEWLGSIER